MRGPFLALRFASRRVGESIGAMASIAIGSGSLAAAMSLRHGTQPPGSGPPGSCELSGAFAIAAALAAVIGFSFIMRERMSSRIDSYRMLKAIGATSFSLFVTLMTEALALALGGGFLSLTVSLPLLLLARTGQAGAVPLSAGPLLLSGLGFALLIALFAALPAAAATRRSSLGESERD